MFEQHCNRNFACHLYHFEHVACLNGNHFQLGGVGCGPKFRDVLREVGYSRVGFACGTASFSKACLFCFFGSSIKAALNFT